MIKLKDTNYPIWKPKDMLYNKELHKPIKGDMAKQSWNMRKNEKTINKKTIQFILQWFDDDVFHQWIYSSVGRWIFLA